MLNAIVLNESEGDVTNKSAEYVRRIAEHFKPAPLMYTLLDEAGQVFSQVAAVPPTLGEKKECYRNSAWLARYSGLYYVEGYAIAGDLTIVLEHAWCVDEQGFIHDPTWSNGHDYFGIVFDINKVDELQRRTGYHGVLGNLLCLRDLGEDGAKKAVLAATVALTPTGITT